MRNPRRIALATGGTAGHVTPALAVAEAYRAAFPDAAVMLLGRVSGFEQHLVATGGHAFETLPAAPLFGATASGRARALSHLVLGIRHARRVLSANRVQLVIGFGGYASAGAVLGARSLGMTAVVHEANAVPGWTNRMLAPLADRVLLGWETALQRFPAGRGACTGTPIRANLARLAGAPRQPPDARCTRLLVCGGSHGSPFLNRHAPALADVLRHDGLTLEVRHLTGHEPPQAVQAAYAAHGVAARVEMYEEDMAAAYCWADLAVTCAGAVTLAELAATALPALLVPLAGAAHDHQAGNAAGFAAATGAPWRREAEWDAAGVGRQLAALLRDRAAWIGLSARIAGFARADAAAAVVAECEALLGGPVRR